MKLVETLQQRNMNKKHYLRYTAKLVQGIAEGSSSAKDIVQLDRQFQSRLNTAANLLDTTNQVLWILETLNRHGTTNSILVNAVKRELQERHTELQLKQEGYNIYAENFLDEKTRNIQEHYFPELYKLVHKLQTENRTLQEKEKQKLFRQAYYTTLSKMYHIPFENQRIKNQAVALVGKNRDAELKTLTLKHVELHTYKETYIAVVPQNYAQQTDDNLEHSKLTCIAKSSTEELNTALKLYRESRQLTFQTCLEAAKKL